MSGLKINIDASGAKSGATVANQALRSIATEATRAVATVEKVNLSMTSAGASSSTFGSGLGSLVSSVRGTVTNLDGMIRSLFSLKSAFANLGVGIAVTTFIRLTKSALDSASALVDTADRIGISVEALQELQFAATQSGLSVEEFTTGMEFFSRQLGEAAGGTGDVSKLFKRLGLDAKELAKDPAKAIGVMADEMSKLSTQAEQGAFSLQLFSRGGAGFINFLQKGSAALRDMRQAARDAGIVIDEELARNAENLGDKFDFVTKIISVQFQAAIIDLAPYLIKTAGLIASAAREIVNLAQAANIMSASVPKQMKILGDEIARTQEHINQLKSQKLQGSDNIISKLFGSTDKDIQFQTEHLAKLEASLKKLQETAAATTPVLEKTGQATGVLTEAQQKAQEEIDKLIQRVKEHGDTLNLTGKALIDYQVAQAKVDGATAAQAETLRKVLTAEQAAIATKEANTKAIHDQAEAERKAAKDKADFAQDVIDANLRVKKMDQELFLIRQKEDAAEAERLQATAARLQILQNELVTIQEEGQLINASLGPKAVLRDLELSIAKARIDRQVATDLAVKSEIALTQEEKDAITAIGAMTKANLEAAAAQQKAADAVADAALSTADLKTVTQGLLSGTQDLGDVAKDLGQTVGLRLVEGIMFGKGQNEQAIIGNFNTLLGVDAAGLFGAQGVNLGQMLTSGIQSVLSSAGVDLGSLFGSSMVEAAETNVGILGTQTVDAASVQWESAAQSGGSMLGTVFGAAMAGAAGLALGKGLSGMLGVGGSKSGKLGGNLGGLAGGIGGGIIGNMLLPGIGGAIGSGLGAAVGAIFGGFIGDLFASTPTKGTEIRKGVKKFLKEIEVSFADELDTGDYFFGATKKLANKLFGGDGGEDFLKASKVILNDKIGPELAKQLQALGTFITADQSKKLGKSVEQTGTTFGNLILDNLGLDPEKIQGAIDEIIDKAGISFEALTDKLNDLFDDDEIGLQFFNDAIMGAVDIFFNDFPAAVQVSKLALESFGEDGLFDIEKFQKKLEELTSIFDVVVNSFVDVVKNAKPGEDIGKLLGEQIQDGLEAIAVDKFLTDFVENKLFEGIDLTDGLNADELALIAQRAAEARAAVDALRDSFGEAGEEVEDVADKVDDLYQTLRNLTQQRFELRLSVISDLASIGAISGADAARARIGANASTVERFANPNGLGARISDFVSDEELADAIEAVRDTRQAVVDLFKAQEQEANNALAKRIQDINEEYNAKRNALQREAQAAAEASAARLDALAQEKDQVQELFQARLDGLRDELQIAQSFRQLAQNLQQTINGIVSSSSRFSGPEQLALAERSAETLRKQIAGSSGEEQARLIQELAQVLQTQLSAAEGVLSEEAFRTMADSIILELEGLRDESAVKGDAVEQIQAAIAATTASMDVALKSIDESIRQEQANAQARQREIQEQTERLSQEEQAAVDAATAETVAEIAALRLVAAEEIRKLAVIEDQMLVEQIKRAEAEIALSEAQYAVLQNMAISLDSMDKNLGSFLSNIAATGGAEGGVAATATQTTGTSAVSVNSSVTVNVSGNTENLDGDSIARAVTQAVQYEWQNGQTGREIRQYVDRS